MALRVDRANGGLYLFLPSITAIKWMATNGGAANPWKIPTL